MPRNTRSTRKGKDVEKDYNKMNEGSPIPEETDQIIPAATKKLTKKQIKAAKKQKHVETSPLLSKHEPDAESDNGVSSNDELCEDVLLECPTFSNSSSAKYTRNQNNNNTKINTFEMSDSDDDDIEIQTAKEKLRQLQKKEEKQRKEEKLRKLVEETRRLEKSLKLSKEKNARTKSKYDTTTADLRSMSDVVQKVDRLMDDKKLNFKSDDSSDCDSESGEHVIDRARRRADSDEERPERKKVGGGDEKKKRSGKESKLTSDVDFPQIWPHSKLRGHFVGKDKKYDDLTIAEFVAGYMSIIMKSKSVEKKARIVHLEELMYLATHKPWKSVLNYHGACLLEIERGNLEWGDNFQLHGLQSTFFNVVGQGPNFQQRGSTSNAFEKPSTPNSMGGNQRVWFCKAYQSGSCTFPGDHNGFMYGRTEFLRHICAKCWQAGKKQSQHSEQSDACPLFKIQL